MLSDFVTDVSGEEPQIGTLIEAFRVLAVLGGGAVHSAYGVHTQFCRGDSGSKKHQEAWFIS